ncbi:MAG TPA: hypothetical protein VK543_07240 [Puia sp.]|nr:hypothetical protein [Puia sp.]
MEYKDSLLAYKADIEHRSLLDWIKAHTSFLKPLHRYTGVLQTVPEGLNFLGWDDKLGENFSLDIRYNEITDLHLGYDSVFKRIEDRSLGIFHFVPLRINFTKNAIEESIYVFANYSSLIRQSDNQELFDDLKSHQK